MSQHDDLIALFENSGKEEDEDINLMDYDVPEDEDDDDDDDDLDDEDEETEEIEECDDEADIAIPDAINPVEMEVEIEQDVSAEPVKRRRGRPSKKDKEAAQNSETPEIKVRRTRRSKDEMAAIAPTPKTPAPSWVTPLNSSPTEGVEIVEFTHHHYKYVPIIDPDSNDSKYFNAFYKNTSKENAKWSTLTKCLSRRYAVAGIQAFYNELKKTMELTDAPAVHCNGFSMACSASTTTEIDAFKSEHMKEAFKIVCGVDPDTIGSGKSKIELYILNSYDGTSRIRINYAFSIGKKMKDYFILNNNSHVFRHHSGSDISTVSLDSINAAKQYEGYCEKLAAYSKGLDAHVDFIANRYFNKKEDKEFYIRSWVEIPESMKNLLTMLLLTSSVLDRAYSSDKHGALSYYVNKLVSRAFSETKEQ